jgi:hypothetical protein
MIDNKGMAKSVLAYIIALRKASFGGYAKIKGSFSAQLYKQTLLLK